LSSSSGEKNLLRRTHIQSQIFTFRLLFRAALVAVLTSIILQAQTVSITHSFAGTDGQYPRYGALTQGRDGKLYGTTESGGASGLGTAFKQQSTGNGDLVLYNFSGPDGSTLDGGLTLASDGNYYGVTGLGGDSDQGILFKITPAGTLTVLHSFGGGSDGAYPVAAPIEATEGNLYGTTEGSNPAILPTVYRYSASSGFSTIYTFTTFSQPLTPMLESSDGNLFLTTPFGTGCGSIVKLTKSGAVKSIRNFPCGGSGPAQPVGSLIQGADGFIYGTTEGGGFSNTGTIFRLDAKTGSLTVLYNFGSIQGDGRGPEAGLVQGGDGNFYGSTTMGGASNYGTLFKITPGGAYTQLYSFPVVNGVFSQFPEPSLVQHTNGFFYGTTEFGGTGLGSIYKLDMGLGPFITFVQSTGKVGRAAQILGQGLTGTTSVTFNGIHATTFKVVSDSYLTALVPSGATTGLVVATTPGGTLTSNRNFVVK
jgi:uncharacterized repeat protein (TIGR03803 family)